MERCEATFGNILLGESCPLNTSLNIDVPGLCKFLCKAGRQCRVQLMLWHLIRLMPECHSHSTQVKSPEDVALTQVQTFIFLSFPSQFPCLPLITHQCLYLYPYLLFSVYFLSFLEKTTRLSQISIEINI